MEKEWEIIEAKKGYKHTFFIKARSIYHAIKRAKLIHLVEKDNIISIKLK